MEMPAFPVSIGDGDLQGRFPPDRLVGFYTVDEIGSAAEGRERSWTVKPLIRIGTAR
jgi:hypothetical protein